MWKSGAGAVQWVKKVRTCVQSPAPWRKKKSSMVTEACDLGAGEEADGSPDLSG